jgi:hypothetical protein
VGKADGGLRALVRAKLAHVGRWSSIETGGTEQGVPDLHLMTRSVGAGRDVWVECKRTEAWAVKFKPAQVGWLYTQWRYGGNALIFTRRMRHGKFDSIYVTSAEHVKDLKQHGLRRVPHLLVAECPDVAQWPWDLIENALRHSR